MKSLLKTPIPCTFIDYDQFRKPGFVIGVASYGNYFQFMIKCEDGWIKDESSIDKICPRVIPAEKVMFSDFDGEVPKPIPGDFDFDKEYRDRLGRETDMQYGLGTYQHFDIRACEVINPCAEIPL